MAFTNEDRLVEKLMPAIRATRPAGQLLHQQAVSRAITPDGYLDPDAILPGTIDPWDFGTSSVTLASSDTGNAVVYMSTVIHLPGDGVYYVKAWGGITGRLSTSSNMNAYISLNSQLSSNYQVPLSSGDTGVAWPSMELAAVSGDVLLELLMRPSGGTLTVEAGFWNYKTRRLRA